MASSSPQRNRLAGWFSRLTKWFVSLPKNHIYVLSSAVFTLIVAIPTIVIIEKFGKNSILYVGTILASGIFIWLLRQNDILWNNIWEQLNRHKTLNLLTTILIVEIFAIAILLLVIDSESEDKPEVDRVKVLCDVGIASPKAHSDRYGAYVFSQPEICVVDFETASRVRNPFTPHDAEITAMCFLSDNELLAMHSDSIGSRLLLNEGEIFEVHLTTTASAAACDRNSDRISTGNTDGTLRFLTLEDDTLIQTHETTLNSAITVIAYSPDGNMVAVGMVDGDIRILDARSSGDELYTNNHNSMPIIDLEFSPDRASILVSATAESVIVWTWTTAGLDPIRSNIDGTNIVDIEFNNNQPNYLLVAGDSVSLWNTGVYPAELVHTYTTTKPSSAVAFNSKNNIVQITNEGTIQEFASEIGIASGTPTLESATVTHTVTPTEIGQTNTPTPTITQTEDTPTDTPTFTPTPTIVIVLTPLITNAQYRNCYNTSNCTITNFADDLTNAATSNQPVIGASWINAARYCQFVGGRLPTVEEIRSSEIVREANTREWLWDGSLELSQITPLNQNNLSAPILQPSGIVSQLGIIQNGEDLIFRCATPSQE